MKYLKLYESKSVGIIYHYTNPEALLKIIEENILKTGQYGWNYFTRNKNYHLKKELVRDEGIRITIDGNSLSNNNKITPYSSWVARDKSRHKEKDISKYDEYEERANDIKNFTKYIISIELDPVKCWIYFLSENLDIYNIIKGKNKAIDTYNNYIKNIRTIYPEIKINYFYKNEDKKNLFDENGFILLNKTEEE
jgi:hypothetical protein